MEQKSIDDNNNSADPPVDDIEPPMQKKDVGSSETESGFPLRLPPGLDQHFGGMLSSMMQQNQGLFDQFMGQRQQPQRRDNNNNDRNDDHHSKPETIRPDMAGKMFEQSFGMINQIFRDQGAADMFGKFFGQQQPRASTTSPSEPQPHMYPTLDDMDNKPQPQQHSTNPKGQIDVETLLTQGIDRLGIKINNQNAGDLLGQLLGQMKKPAQASASTPEQQPTPSSDERHFYPKLDDLDFDNKPKPATPPPQPSNQSQRPVNLDNVINQGIDAIGSALKGNAGSIFSSFLKNTITTKTSSSSDYNATYDERPRPKPTPAPQPSTNNHQPFKTVDVEFSDDVRPPPSAPSAPPAPVPTNAPESVPKPAAPTAPSAVQPERKSETKTTKEEGKDDDESKKDEKIIDFIPDDAFEAAFDAMAFKD